LLSSDRAQEDDHDASLCVIDMLLEKVSKACVHDIYQVTPIRGHSCHFVVLFDKTSHLCTCLLLINRGIFCRHFFAVMLSTESACFHLGLVAKRWFKESDCSNLADVLNSMSAVYITSNSDIPQECNSENNSFDQIVKLRGNYMFAEPFREIVNKRYRYVSYFLFCYEIIIIKVIQLWFFLLLCTRYGVSQGLTKQAMDLAIETNTDEELNRILRQWIAQKKIHSLHSDEYNQPVIILNPEHVRTKGASSKRIKSAFENTKASKETTKASNMKKVCVTLFFSVYYIAYLYYNYIF
jgi:hypothetical protein